jgi:hypothetical protein
MTGDARINDLMRECEIFHVQQAGCAGWKWRAVSPAGTEQVSEHVYELFYECVLAARAQGYAPSPALKCT